MNAIRVGIVGVGRIGRMHAGIVAHQLPQARLTAVYDVATSVAEDVASQLGTVSTATVDDLIDTVDAVAICTATGTHLDIIERCARAGKAVLCEKPVASTIADIDLAAAAVEASGIPFMVGFNRRFDPSHQAVRDAVAAGTVGRTLLAHIVSRDPAPPPLEYIRGGGGLFLDMTIHDFDMARYLIASPVVRVMAQGGALIDPRVAAEGDIDVALTVLTHADGTITTIDNSRQAPYGYDQRLEVLGTLGMVQSENVRINQSRVSDAAGVHVQPLQNFFIERYTEAYLREWQAFLHYITEGGPSPASVADGRAAAELGEAAWTSLRTGTPVDITPR